VSGRPGIPSLDRYRIPRPAAAERAPSGAARRARYLHPGQILVATEPTVFTTILGSCVSVCLYDGHRRVGGINHFMLPNWAGRGRASARFGNIAVESLIERMLAAGCSALDLEARMFGGSHLLRGSDDAAEPSLTSALGARNVEVARALLQAARIEILAEDVGGRFGRKLTFRSDDGSVQVKALQSSASAGEAEVTRAPATRKLWTAK
jgi:chemotaxis protein CheD